MNLNPFSWWNKPALKVQDPENSRRGSSGVYTGRRVDVAGAMQISTWWACTRLLSETVGTLPAGFYERQADGSKKPATDHDLYTLLHDSPNADQTAVQFWEGLVLSICTYGDGVAMKEMSSDGKRILALTPISAAPGDLTIRRDDRGALRYRFNHRGKTYDLSEDRIFHVRGFGAGGDRGLSPIAFARQSLGLADAIALSAGSTFKNGMKASVFFKAPAGVKLDKEQREDFKKAFIDPYVGAEANTSAGLLEHGFDVSTVSLPPKDAEMLLSWRFTVEEICRWHRVPPILIGHSAPGQTMFGAGVEQIMLAWYTLGLRPYLTRIEQAIKKQLLRPEERQRYFCEFNIEGLLRADSAGRAALYASAGQNGWMDRNEIRAKENLPSRPGADKLTVQSNLLPIEQLGQAVGSPEQQLRSAMSNLLFGGDLDSIIDARMKAMMGHNGGPQLDEE
ncbi:phage portal protein [Pararhizobium sp. BT-229]|uniref:phage portal protein n=1 Tax=Pararhizobium sp. BT-229 TaxID=2986923 RepID=UPI0021F763A1|nr:phage portal protein [Pararhizobium sp. BT-229]MCV9960395.1 phage portal protein [Pararhizobium sp. BT-229]